MVRKSSSASQRSGFEAAWAALTPAQQAEVIDGFRTALIDVFGSVTGSGGGGSRADAAFERASRDLQSHQLGQARPRPARHIRFTGGETQILASARKPGVDEAWARLAGTAREIQARRSGPNR